MALNPTSSPRRSIREPWPSAACDPWAVCVRGPCCHHCVRQGRCPRGRSRLCWKCTDSAADQCAHSCGENVVSIRKFVYDGSTAAATSMGLHVHPHWRCTQKRHAGVLGGAPAHPIAQVASLRMLLVLVVCAPTHTVWALAHTRAALYTNCKWMESCERRVVGQPLGATQRLLSIGILLRVGARAGRSWCSMNGCWVGEQPLAMSWSEGATPGTELEWGSNHWSLVGVGEQPLMETVPVWKQFPPTAILSSLMRCSPIATTCGHRFAVSRCAQWSLGKVDHLSIGNDVFWQRYASIAPLVVACRQCSLGNEMQSVVAWQPGAAALQHDAVNGRLARCEQCM